MAGQLVFFGMPEVGRIRLPVPPQLASWDRAGSPSQQQLIAYLEQVNRIVHPVFGRVTGPVALRLDVGLSESTPRLEQHDLDNYLFPLIRTVDRPDRRIVSVWASKQHADDSFITVGPARPVPDRRDWPIRRDLVTQVSTESTAFKEQIHQQLQDLPELPAGGVHLQIGYLVGPRRYWPNLWKPTIDALDPILGRTYTELQWNPRDGRIVLLGLHCAVNLTLRNAVRIGIRAKSAHE